MTTVNSTSSCARKNIASLLRRIKSIVRVYVSVYVFTFIHRDDFICLEQIDDFAMKAWLTLSSPFIATLEWSIASF